MATKKRKKKTAPTSKPRHTMLVMNGEELRAALKNAERDDVIECAAGTYVLNGPPIAIPPGVQVTVVRKTESNVGCDHCAGSESDHERGCPKAPTASILDAIAAFELAWTQLPPLVRAGMASGVVERMGIIAAEHDKRIELFQRLRLERRAEVLRRFTRATGAIQTLFATLCLQADAEAAKRGIDLDVQPDPDTQFALGT